MKVAAVLSAVFCAGKHTRDQSPGSRSEKWTAETDFKLKPDVIQLND